MKHSFLRKKAKRAVSLLAAASVAAGQLASASMTVTAIDTAQTADIIPQKALWWGDETSAAESADGNAVSYGDVNGDGKIDAIDASLIVAYATKGEESDIDLTAADVDLDGKVTLHDTELILDAYALAVTGQKESILPYEGPFEWNYYPDPANYEIINKGMTWQEAEEFCESRGGHLVTINSSQEQIVVESLLRAVAEPKNSYWIGAKRDSDIKWVTGEEMSYTNWASGQPDTYSETAVMMYYNPYPGVEGQDFGKWNDIKPDGSNIGEDFFGTENFGFICEYDNNIVSERQEWTDATSLPKSGVYKLMCDVDTSSIYVNDFLDLDLNGHTVSINSIDVIGKMNVRDSSDAKNGTMNEKSSGNLFDVDGKLSIYGGTFNGNETGNDSATVGVNGNGCFDLYGGTVTSYYSNPLSLRNSYGVTNLIGGTLKNTSKHTTNSHSVGCTIWLNGSYSGTLNIKGSEVISDIDSAIYGETSKGTINISGGKLAGEGNYGINCTGDIPINLKGNISITGKNGGVYLPKGKRLNFTDKVNSAAISVFAEESGIITNNFAKSGYDKSIAPYLKDVGVNGTVSFDEIGELRIDIADVATTTTTTSTTSNTSTSTTSTTSTSTTSSTSTTTTSTTTTTTTTLGPLPDKDHYKVFSETLTWDEAEAYCRSINGHLATLTSLEEQAQITNLLTEAGLSECWLGGKRDENGEFGWITGEPMVYTNWNGGEPNNVGGHENYIHTYSSGKWNDLPGDNRKYFICEWDDVQDTQTTSATTTASTTTTSITSKATDTTTTSSSATTDSNTDITTYTTVTTVTATLITDITKEPFAAVTTVYDPQLEKTINAEKNEKLKITGELTAKPMTLDEIKEAGIDVYDYENYHYFKYSVELTFRDEPIIFTKYEVVPISNDETSCEDSTPTPTPGPMVTYHGEKKKVLEAPVNIPEYEISISSYEYEDQEMFIIIYGEDKWLKEFYDVQLIVMNTDKETLEDCSATINVPDGLTLCNSEQTQYVGDLLPYSVRDVHWYLRGDVAGDYSISALFKGKNDGDTFSYSFTTKEDVHVYAGDALKLTIAVPGYSCYKYGYPIKITMTNTSDKPIYNLQHKADVEHGYYSYTHIHNNGTSTIIKSSVPLGGATKTIDVNELLPGESAVIDLKISDMWKSPLQKRLENSKLFIDAISLGLKSTLGGFIASFASKFIDGITVIHVLDGTVVTTLKGSTTEVPYELIVTDNLDEIGKDRTFSLTEAIVSSAIDQGPKGLKTFYYENLTFTNAFEFVSGIKNDMEEDWKRVENNEITVEQFQEKYNQEYLDYIFGNLGNVFNIVGWDCASIVEIENDIYKILSVPVDFSGGTAYVTDKDGNIIQKGVSVSRDPKPGSFRTVRASEESDFEFEILTGDFEYSNGIYSFSEDSLIRMKANKPGEIYTVHFVADDGNEDQFTFITVPKHECNSDKYYVVSAPNSEEDGIAIQFCEVCGEPLDSRHIPDSFCAMLSDGQMFQNVYQAAKYAENNYEETELSLFGDITLDKDLLIPANVKLLITPFANITFNNSARIVVGDNHIDFTKKLKEYISEDKSLINNDNKPATTTVSAVNTNIPISTTTTTVTTTAATTTIDAAAEADKKLAKQAVIDYQGKTAKQVGFTDVQTTEDGKREITLMDNEGNVLDTYTIDPETGIGTNAAGEAVKLPQTGNNSMTNVLIAFGAVMMIVFGLSAVMTSGVLDNRKRDEK